MAEILLEAHHNYVNKSLKGHKKSESPVDKFPKIIKKS